MTTKLTSTIRRQPPPMTSVGRLRALALNLHWTWDPDAQSLFASIDPALWRATHHNPIKTINLLSSDARAAIERDPAKGEHLTRCERGLKQYLAARTWFDRTRRKSLNGEPLVAYFCMEFAIHECLPIYSGGLGVLAGDHVKSASDLGVPLVAVGLLYRNGYYTQQLNPDGSTRVIYPHVDFEQLPIEDTGASIDVPIGRANVRAKVWRAQVGRCPIYLLDTDVAPNKPADRAITRHLYGGDRDVRIRQEVLLGVGGVIALEALRLTPTVYHLNEGHAAFCGLERLRRLRARGVQLDDATAGVRATTVFTTHTPVPAGHDRFDAKLVRKYLPQMREIDGDWLGLGQEDPSQRNAEIVMTVLALNLAEHVNGVSALHGQVSRQMWQHLPGARGRDIGHITNGIHSETWLAPELRPLYDKYLRPQTIGRPGKIDRPEKGDIPISGGREKIEMSPFSWQRADRVPSAELWAARNMLRARLVRHVRNRLIEQTVRRLGSPEEIAQANEAFDERALTIGFARRFATYKRAPLIFRDAKRLARILNNEDRPVQLVFAGKAHPADAGGQAFAQAIFRRAAESRFRGRVLILEDYDMELGRMLTSGCDVWLNNPLRPQEASGTSGMKPPLHGGINCSVLDGWWPEAYDGTNGWAINGRQFKSRAQQDKHDAEQIYHLLEREIVPAFYDRDRAGVPRRWVARMVASMKTVCGQFNTHRMVGEYWEKYYRGAHDAAVGRLPDRTASR
jgi:starch phosphorylase